MSVLNVNKIPFLHLFSMLLLSYQLYTFTLASSIGLESLLIVLMHPNLHLHYSQFQLKNLQDNVVG